MQDEDKSEYLHSKHPKAHLIAAATAENVCKRWNLLHNDGGRRVARSKHHQLQCCARRQLLDRIDCLLATVSPDVDVVNCNDDVPWAQSCSVSNSVGSNSLNREPTTAFSKFNFLHQVAKIKGDSARFAVSYAVLERRKTN